MKGVIFVELLKMAEDDFGEDAVDMVLDKIDLDNDGAFTTVGNYPCSELVKIVMAFSEHSGISPEALQRKFGHWVMAHFVEHYAEFFAGKADSFAMLEAVDGEIHVEVKKLYPDADLPVFSTERMGADHLEMTYSSPRPLVEFCYGMIEACLDHFDETADIQQCPVTHQENATKFDIRLTEQGRKSHERRN
ncbi:heme NO-binding domain-containing protein [Yoonia sp.]|uniref:heme NO-binding domain-containing protein n=1 Tax=Yoonia sp. TaxID=2212373 RepID=UPI00238D579C|nr:heme NO-binding domain-containing protein [Yoonia sp.]MDE0852049.1 heme NO-binding domain-containing protein [Yoonia sp.]